MVRKARSAISNVAHQLATGQRKGAGMDDINFTPQQITLPGKSRCQRSSAKASAALPSRTKEKIYETPLYPLGCVVIFNAHS